MQTKPVLEVMQIPGSPLRIPEVQYESVQMVGNNLKSSETAYASSNTASNRQPCIVSKVEINFSSRSSALASGW